MGTCMDTSVTKPGDYRRMPELDLNFSVDIPDLQREAYDKATREGDIVALKQVLLRACSPSQVDVIEQFLPAELVFPV